MAPPPDNVKSTNVVVVVVRACQYALYGVTYSVCPIGAFFPPHRISHYGANDGNLPMVVQSDQCTLHGGSFSVRTTGRFAPPYWSPHP